MPKKGGEKATEANNSNAPATIVVTLPADASLTVDGNATTSTTERRTFITPELETSADYVYTLRAEIVREGRSIVQTQQITVRGGQTTEVPFNLSAQGVASR
ncbi:MAG: TIGR03000 domain-containing protein [Gemmataceae bacterium]|nr:TIGR03000 domain-containing protein [Gemmataceae bacterium]